MGGADAIVIETMPALEEASIAIRAARENSNLTVMATMTFDKGPRGYFTMMGVTPADGARRLAEAGAAVVGTNCGLAIEHLLEIVVAMRGATDRPILTHVNAGIPRIVGKEIVYPDSPEHMAKHMPQMGEAGASIVGGCCGTGPNHVRAFVKSLK